MKLQTVLYWLDEESTSEDKALIAKVVERYYEPSKYEFIPKHLISKFKSINWHVQNEIKMEEFLDKLKNGDI